jgi:hypothetical protein
VKVVSYLKVDLGWNEDVGFRAADWLEQGKQEYRPQPNLRLIPFQRKWEITGRR